MDYMTVAEKAMGRIKKGVFLTVQSGDMVNTMTIGWATFGYIWRKPIMMIAVRSSRHTFGIIETAKDFTVSIPAVNMDKEIAFCGTKSGRDMNKFNACGLKAAASKNVVSPIIKVPGLHYECQIVFKAAMDPEHLAETYASLYPEKDYHTLYFGEIVACYETE
jgi:flavin reductase (DIM6/NTAB) family NADH-FMN oxidoreductase RutF